MALRRDTCDPELIYRIEPGEPYFTDLRERWSAALQAAHIGIPRPPYAKPALTPQRIQVRSGKVRSTHGPEIHILCQTILLGLTATNGTKPVTFNRPLRHALISALVTRDQKDSALSEMLL
jgi:hypothetical protein